MKHVIVGASARKIFAVVFAAAVVAACGDDKLPNVATTPSLNPAGSTVAPVAPAPGATTPAANPPVAGLPTPPAGTVPTDQDALPQISGAPKTQAQANEAYSFVPTAADANGDSLFFSIANRPAWLNFASATGALTGTPTAAQIGIYRNVTIQVAAGGAYETLAPFDIEVVAVGQGAITLAWIPPTQNADGSPLTNLAGYRISYGEASGVYTTVVSLSNPGLVSHLIEGLVPSTYYFVISAYNSLGAQSSWSNEASKTI